MTATTKPATGPLIMEQILELKEEVKAIRETQQRRERQIAGLSQQIDRFLAAEIDLTGTLVQVRSVVGANRDTVGELITAARELKRTIDTALDLAVSDPDLLERDKAA